MNKVILMGRLARDPEVRRSNDLNVARYSLAVDRPKKEGQEAAADFISCVAFGKSADFAEKFLKKGTKILVEGRIQTGSYTNKDNQKVYTTDVIIEHSEFAESKKDGFSQINAPVETEENPSNGFMNIPEGIEEELPFAQPTR